jgi:hypothetical protein
MTITRMETNPTSFPNTLSPIFYPNARSRDYSLTAEGTTGTNVFVLEVMNVAPRIHGG